MRSTLAGAIVFCSVIHFHRLQISASIIYTSPEIYERRNGIYIAALFPYLTQTQCWKGRQVAGEGACRHGQQKEALHTCLCCSGPGRKETSSDCKGNGSGEDKCDTHCRVPATLSLLDQGSELLEHTQHILGKQTRILYFNRKL